MLLLLMQWWRLQRRLRALLLLLQRGRGREIGGQVTQLIHEGRLGMGLLLLVGGLLLQQRRFVIGYEAGQSRQHG